jgi:hypothetical protein
MTAEMRCARDLAEYQVGGEAAFVWQASLNAYGEGPQ